MLKIIILLLFLILATAIYMFGLFNDTKREIKNVKDKAEWHYTEQSDTSNLEDAVTFIDGDEEQNDTNEDINNETIDDVAEKNDVPDITTNQPDNTQEDMPTDSGQVETTVKPNDNYNNNIYEDMKDLYYGRLYIPELNINVALYYGIKQYITDRLDSANIFIVERRNYFIIADHNNQEFETLLNIRVGMTGYIQNKYDNIGRINIECVDVFNGHNIGKLTDTNGVEVIPDVDYLMYTCRDSSRNIIICLWNKTN